MVRQELLKEPLTLSAIESTILRLLLLRPSIIGLFLINLAGTLKSDRYDLLFDLNQQATKHLLEKNTALLV